MYKLFNHFFAFIYFTLYRCSILFLWSPEFSESVDRRGIHQLAATCKTNKKTTVVFCRPSDGKVSLFSEDLEFRAAVASIHNLVPCFSFMEGEKKVRLSWIVDDFFP